MNNFHYADAVADMANKKYICDRCKRGAKCKDFTGAGSGKKYHHIYCRDFEEVTNGTNET